METKKIEIKNIFLNKFPMSDIKDLTDQQVLQEIKEAIGQGWDVNKLYGDNDNFYNALHVCALKAHMQSCLFLLDKGVDPNFASGNESTAFTFLLDTVHDKDVGVENFLNICQKLKSYGADLSLPGYEKKSPLELYARFGTDLDDRVVDFLIDHADFENTFLLNEIIKEPKYLNFRVLKKIMATHKINLKKFIEPNENNKNSQSYWDDIPFYLKGKHGKKQFVFVEWLNNKSEFEFDKIHTIYEYSDKEENLFEINLLGLSIFNKNKAMFDWVMKKRPEFINQIFRVNNEEYNFLEFSIICNFRHGIRMSLKKMNNEELLEVNPEYYKKLSKKFKRTESSRALELFDRLYKSLFYKKLNNKYAEKNSKSKKLKI